MLIYMLYNRRLHTVLAKRPVAAADAASATTNTITAMTIVIIAVVAFCSYALIIFLALFLSHISRSFAHASKQSMHACDPAPTRLQREEQQRQQRTIICLISP